MNSTSRTVENFLWLGDEGARIKEELFKSAISCAENGYYVLYIASKPLEKLPEVEKPHTEILKYIIFMYFSNIDDLISKLLKLHIWSITPKMVIVDSLQSFSSKYGTEETIEKFCLLVASLFSYINSASQTLNQLCSSIVSISENSTLPDGLIQKLIDMFYYKPEHLKRIPVA